MLNGDHHCAGVYDITERNEVGGILWWDQENQLMQSIFCYLFKCSRMPRFYWPNSINPDTGKRYNLDFPKLTLEIWLKLNRFD